MMRVKSKRYRSLDFLKFFCCFFVVCIHVPFPGLIGELFQSAICRVAVPIFFMITGFFYSITKDKKREKSQIYKVLILILIATVLSFIVRVLVNLYKGTLSDYLSGFANYRIWLNMLIFNTNPFGGHLWYLNALLYVLLIVFVFEKFLKRKYLYYLIFVLLGIGLIFGPYSFYIFGYKLPVEYHRNFLFIGMPFFLLGDFIFINKYKLFSFSKKTFILFFILFLVFLVVSFLESFFVNKASGSLSDIYITTVPLVVLSFLLCVRVTNTSIENHKPFMFLSNFGNKYSTMIYIFQPIFIAANGLLLNKLSSELYIWFAPLLVFFATLLFSIGFCVLRDSFYCYLQAKENV